MERINGISVGLDQLGVDDRCGPGVLKDPISVRFECSAQLYGNIIVKQGK